jgi:hypothetical protein
MDDGIGAAFIIAFVAMTIIGTLCGIAELLCAIL